MAVLVMIRHPASRRYTVNIIHAYTLVNGQPPAEAEMTRFFQVMPPTVHRMVIALEQAGLISGRPRSIAVLVQQDDLPRLNPALVNRRNQRDRTIVSPNSEGRYVTLV